LYDNSNFEDLDSYKKHEFALKIKASDGRELILGLETSGDKHLWIQAINSCRTRQPRCEYNGSLVPTYPTAVSTLEYVPTAGVVVSASVHSFKLRIWSAKSKQLVSEVDPLGSEKASHTLSRILAFEDFICMIVDKVIFMLDQSFQFKFGMKGSKKAIQSILLVSSRFGNRLWVADDKVLYVFDPRTRTKIDTIELESVCCMTQIGQEVWVAAGPSINILDCDTGRIVKQLPEQHSTAILFLVSSVAQLWSVAKDNSVLVWKR